MTAAELAEFLGYRRFRMGHETLLQEDVQTALKAVGAEFEREKVLGPGERVDFLVDGHIALELKIRANRKRIFRQLERYATYSQIDAIVLLTASAMGLPALIGDKPAYFVHLGRSSL